MNRDISRWWRWLDQPRVDDPSSPERYARDVRVELLRIRPGDECDVSMLVELVGAKVRVVQRGAGGSPVTAFTIPGQETGFDIVLSDPLSLDRVERTLPDIDALGCGPRSFAIAHEVGHMLFYDRRSDPPTRQTSPCEAEERFCDAFAAALLRA